MVCRYVASWVCGILEVFSRAEPRHVGLGSETYQPSIKEKRIPVNPKIAPFLTNGKLAVHEGHM